MFTACAAVAIALATALSMGTGSVHAAPTIDDPLTIQKCGTCHGLDKVTVARKAPAEWERTVGIMRQSGADMTDDQARRVSEYLADLLPPLISPSGPLIADAFVREKCGACHGLELVESVRKTPEGWRATVEYMRWRAKRKKKGRYSRVEGQRITNYLARVLPLLPEERARLESVDYPAAVKEGCTSCHAMQPLRAMVKTSAQWKRTIKHMRGYRGGPSSKEGRAALDYLSRAQASDTAAWRDYRAQGGLQPGGLAGAWQIAGRDAQGAFAGEITFTPRADPNDPGRDRYAVRRHVVYADAGSQPSERTWEGSAELYGPATLRTTYTLGGGAAGLTAALQHSFGEELALTGQTRVVVTGDLRREDPASGDAYAGTYDCRSLPGSGGRERYRRQSLGSVLLAMDPPALTQGEQKTVTLIGQGLSASSVDLGPGVEVLDAKVSQGGRFLRVQVRVASDASPGARTARAGGQSLAEACWVVPGIDEIRIESTSHESGTFSDAPAIPLTRIGGAPVSSKAKQDGARRMAPVTTRLRAVAYWNGPDGQRRTADDVRVGVVPVEFQTLACDVDEPDDLPDGSATVELADFGVFALRPNPGKTESWGQISSDGLVVPGSEAANFHTNTGDNRGTVLVTAIYAGEGISQRALETPPEGFYGLPARVEGRWKGFIGREFTIQPTGPAEYVFESKSPGLFGKKHRLTLRKLDGGAWELHRIHLKKKKESTIALQQVEPGRLRDADDKFEFVAPSGATYRRRYDTSRKALVDYTVVVLSPPDWVAWFPWTEVPHHYPD